MPAVGNVDCSEGEWNVSGNWDDMAEFIATAIDPQGPGLWLVELGAGRTVVASVIPSASGGIERLAPGDSVRIRFRQGRKTPRILGYSEVDRSGQPTKHQN
jgi:hypothetical protein